MLWNLAWDDTESLLTPDNFSAGRDDLVVKVAEALGFTGAPGVYCLLDRSMRRVYGLESPRGGPSFRLGLGARSLERVVLFPVWPCMNCLPSCSDCSVAESGHAGQSPDLPCTCRSPGLTKPREFCEPCRFADALSNLTRSPVVTVNNSPYGICVMRRICCACGQYLNVARRQLS